MHQLLRDNNLQTTGETTRVYFVLIAAKYGVPLLAGTQSEDFATPGITMHVKFVLVCSWRSYPCRSIAYRNDESGYFSKQAKAIRNSRCRQIG